MSITAVGHQSLSLLKSLVKGLCLVHCQNRAQLLMSELLGNVHRLHLADKDLCGLRNGHPCHSSDLRRRLSNDLRVYSAVDDDGLSHLIQLIRL